jgi:hypothetical protein
LCTRRHNLGYEPAARAKPQVAQTAILSNPAFFHASLADQKVQKTKLYSVFIAMNRHELTAIIAAIILHGRVKTSISESVEAADALVSTIYGPHLTPKAFFPSDDKTP